MTIRSCSDVAAIVKIHAFDSVETNQELSNGVQSYTSGNQPGWHSISLSNDLKVLTNFQETQSGQPPSQSISSFVWSASSSTQVLLKPMSTAEIPLQICIFSPGTYDLSNYAVHWSLQLSDAEGSSAIGATRQSSGTGPGHPYYLTALQSPGSKVPDLLRTLLCIFCYVLCQINSIYVIVQSLFYDVFPFVNLCFELCERGASIIENAHGRLMLRACLGQSLDPINQIAVMWFALK